MDSTGNPSSAGHTQGTVEPTGGRQSGMDNSVCNQEAKVLRQESQPAWGTGGHLGVEEEVPPPQVPPRPAKVTGIRCKDTEVGATEGEWQPVGGEPHFKASILPHTHAFSKFHNAHSRGIICAELERTDFRCLSWKWKRPVGVLQRLCP